MMLSATQLPRQTPSSPVPHVWLPGLRVWAQLRSHTSCPSPGAEVNGSRCAEPQESKRHCLCNAPKDTYCGEDSSPTACTLLQPFSPRSCQENGKCSFGDVTSGQRDLSCPICLGSVEEARVAVLWWCMHVFCVDCIEKWSLMQRTCPLCKRCFQGWYYNIRGPSDFEEKRLVDVPRRVEVVHNSNLSHEHSRRTGLSRLSYIRDSRWAFRRTHRQTRALRRMRSFGFSRLSRSTGNMEGNAEVKYAQKALSWRASIYKRGLKAVPPHFEGRVSLKVTSVRDPDVKARIERRLQPWICRELQAILGDPDPSVLVHFVCSLWFSILLQREVITKSHHCIDRSIDNNCAEGSIPEWGNFQRDVDAVRQLEPFLDSRASAFWHELVCFADSPLTMKAYDSVVVYHKERENDLSLRDSHNRDY
eukprot:c28266_g1_i2 orf=162-1418(+)